MTLGIGRCEDEVVEIPLQPPTDFPGLIDRERAVLLDLLAQLEPDAWTRPSPCPGWSVLDVAVHVLGDDIGVLARDRDGYFGTVPLGELDSEEDQVAFVDDLNNLWVQAGRRLSPQLVIELLRWAGGELVEIYRRQDPSAVTASVSWASDQPVPKWLDQARELTERWVHHQQIRIGIGRSTWLDPEMTGAVLDTFRWAYPYRLSRISRPPGTAVEVEVTGVVERRWRWIATAGGWSPADPDSGGSPVARLSLDADAAWRLLTNGIPARLQPKPVTNRDPELSRVLLRTRAIIGLPNA
jgi:uncharacterized protein (TIGR03083 family)